MNELLDFLRDGILLAKGMIDRLLNVLTPVAIIASIFLFNDAYHDAEYFLAATPICGVLAVNYILGNGFKIWNKEQ